MKAQSFVPNIFQQLYYTATFMIKDAVPVLHTKLRTRDICSLDFTWLSRRSAKELIVTCMEYTWWYGAYGDVRGITHIFRFLCIWWHYFIHLYSFYDRLCLTDRIVARWYGLVAAPTPLIPAPALPASRCHLRTQVHSVGEQPAGRHGSRLGW